MLHDIVVDIIPATRPDGGVIVCLNGFAGRGDAENVFGASHQPLFLAAVNEGWEGYEGFFV